MAEEGFKRKLTAILSADVAGYSRLMSEDEAHTVKTLATYRNFIASLTKQHHGRVVDSPGDNVPRMFLEKGKITQDMISLLDKWRHTGINVFSGPCILPRYEKSMENLARYIICASFFRERMTCHRKTDQVEYQFPIIDNLWAMVTAYSHMLGCRQTRNTICYFRLSRFPKTSSYLFRSI